VPRDSPATATAHHYGVHQDLVETRLERVYLEPARRRSEPARHERAALSFEERSPPPSNAR